MARPYPAVPTPLGVTVISGLTVGTTTPCPTPSPHPSSCRAPAAGSLLSIRQPRTRVTFPVVPVAPCLAQPGSNTPAFSRSHTLPRKTRLLAASPGSPDLPWLQSDQLGDTSPCPWEKSPASYSVSLHSFLFHCLPKNPSRGAWSNRCLLRSPGWLPALETSCRHRSTLRSQEKAEGSGKRSCWGSRAPHPALCPHPLAWHHQEPAEGNECRETRNAFGCCPDLPGAHGAADAPCSPAAKGWGAA